MSADGQFDKMLARIRTGVPFTTAEAAEFRQAAMGEMLDAVVNPDPEMPQVLTDVFAKMLPRLDAADAEAAEWEGRMGDLVEALKRCPLIVVAYVAYLERRRSEIVSQAAESLAALVDDQLETLFSPPAQRKPEERDVHEIGGRTLVVLSTDDEFTVLCDPALLTTVKIPTSSMMAVPASRMPLIAFADLRRNALDDNQPFADGNGADE